MPPKIYRYIFWIGYISVLIATFLPVAGELNKIRLGPDAFHIRLDHLLHFAVYFLICMYFLFGLRKGIALFEKNSLLKFVLLILLLATVTEVVQLWVPERAFNPMDWVANVAGVVIGVGIIVMAQRHYGMKA
jgi:VanZ family protein